MQLFPFTDCGREEIPREVVSSAEILQGSARVSQGYIWRLSISIYGGQAMKHHVGQLLVGVFRLA
jgi:hypothetical protein